MSKPDPRQEAHSRFGTAICVGASRNEAASLAAAAVASSSSVPVVEE